MCEQIQSNGAMNFTFQGGYEVEALTVARTIEALVELATTVSHEKYPEAKVGLSVRAVAKGSLMFEFAAMLQSNPNLLSSQNIQCAKNIIEIMSSAFQIKKFLKGRKPKEKKLSKECLTLQNSEGAEIRLPADANIYFINTNIDMSVGRVVEQASSSSGVSGISVQSGSGAPVSISREEFECCAVPIDIKDSQDQTMTVIRHKEVLFVRKPDLDAKSQWEFTSDRRILANVADEDFLERVKASDIAFSRKTYIVADLSVTLAMKEDGTPDETKCKYLVTKVYEIHHPDNSQTTLE